MNPETSTLSIEDLSVGQNMAHLRETALAQLQTLSGQTWTDHNLADPGITLLESLCLVISDLGYKLALPLDKVLHHALDEAPYKHWAAEQILTGNAVTLMDWHKVMLDMPGVRTVQVNPVKDAPSKLDFLIFTDNENALTVESVLNRFADYRNVNTELNSLSIVYSTGKETVLYGAVKGETPVSEDVKLNMTFELDPDADIPNTIAALLTRLESKISPTIPKYHSFEQISALGQEPPHVILGPTLNEGWMLEEDISRSNVIPFIFSSDLLNFIDDVPGLKRVHQLSLSKTNLDATDPAPNTYANWQISGKKNSDVFNPGFFSIDWQDLLGSGNENTDPSAAKNSLRLIIGGQSVVLSRSQKDQISAILAQKHGQKSNDLSVEQHLEVELESHYQSLGRYRSLLHELPNIYKLIDSRLAGSEISDEQASILQFKGYLHLFDQVLADQHAQIELLRQFLALPREHWFTHIAPVFDKMLASENLFEADVKKFTLAIAGLPHTQLSQPILDVPGQQHLLGSYFEHYQKHALQQSIEPFFDLQQLRRLRDSMRHILARYGEQMLPSELLKYREVFQIYLPIFNQYKPFDKLSLQSTDFVERLATLKECVDLSRFLLELPELTGKRCGAYNFMMSRPENAQLAAISKRAMRLLGCSHPGQMPMAMYNKESFYLLEGALLEGPVKDPLNNHLNIAQSLYFVIPEWPSRFANNEFREALISIVSAGSPVAYASHFRFLNRQSMSLFERLYFGWLQAFKQAQLHPNQSERVELKTELSQVLIAALSAEEQDSELAEVFADLVISAMEKREKNWDRILEDTAAVVTDILGESFDSTPFNPVSDFASLKQAISKVLIAELEDDALTDTVIYMVAHLQIDHLCSPAMLSQATISKGFTIGYKTLDYLKPVFPVSATPINQSSSRVLKFTVANSAPHTI